MKYIISVFTLVAVSALGAGSQPVARRAPAVPAGTAQRTPAAALPPAAGQRPPENADQYADRVQEEAFRGCDRGASALEGTDNTGGASGAATRRPSAGGQR